MGMTLRSHRLRARRAPSRCATPWPRPRAASRWRRSPSWCRRTTSAWPPGGCWPRARSGRSPAPGSGWRRSPSSPPTGWPSCSAPPPSPGRAGGRCPPRCWPPPCGPSWPPTPGLFAPVAEHPATESALVATYRELRDLSPAALDALAGAERPRRRGRAAPPGHPGAARAAAGTTRKTCSPPPPRLAGSPAAAALGALVVHLPQRLTQHSARLLAALAEHVPTTVIAGGTGRARGRRRGRSTRSRRLGARPTGAAGRRPARRSPPTAPRCSPRPTPTRRCAPRCAPSSTPCAPAPARPHRRAPRQPRALRPPRPRAAPRRRHRHQRRRRRARSPARVAGRTLLDLLALPGRRLPAPGRVRLAVVGADPPRRPARAHHRLGAAVARGRGGRRAHDWDHRLTQLALLADDPRRRGRARRRGARVAARAAAGRRRAGPRSCAPSCSA